MGNVQDCFPFQGSSREEDVGQRLKDLIREIQSDAKLDKKTVVEIQRLLAPRGVVVDEESASQDFFEVQLNSQDAAKPDQNLMDENLKLRNMIAEYEEKIQHLSKFQKMDDKTNKLSLDKENMKRNEEVIQERERLQTALQNLQKKNAALMTENEVHKKLLSDTNLELDHEKDENLEKQKELESKISEYLEKAQEMKKKIHELEQESNPNIFTFKNDETSLSQKRDELLARIDSIFNDENFDNFKRLVLTSFDKSEQTKILKSKIHSFCACQLSSKIEKLSQEFCLKHKISHVEEAKKLFFDSKEEKNTLISTFWNQLSSNFNEIFLKEHGNLSNSDDEKINLFLEKIFEICFEMKGLKLSFIVPKQDDDFNEMICQPRNSEAVSNLKQKKIEMTMKPGVIIQDIETWTKMIKRTADVILQN